MKRYWKSSVLIITILLSIGSFYIHSAYSASKFPDFFIKKQEGISEAAGPVILKGDYQIGTGTGEILEITSKGSDYMSERSFLHQIDNLNGESENVIKLQKDHRSFMRGKHWEEYFYNDQVALVYAEVEYDLQDESTRFAFQIAALDKKGGDETSFKWNVPNGGTYSFIEVVDVQSSANQLKVITKNELNQKVVEGGEIQEIHVYTFDLSGKRLVSDEVILSESNERPNVHVYFETIPGVNKMAPGEYIANKKVKVDTTPESTGKEPESTVQGLFVYNLKDKKQIEVNLPKEIVESLNTGYFLDGTMLYIASEKEGKARIIVYNLENKKVDNEIQFPLGGEDMVFKQTLIKNGRIYLLASKAEPENRQRQETIIIADLKTKKTLYRGTVTNKKEHKQTNATLNINELTLK